MASVTGEDMKVPYVVKGRQVVLDFGSRFARMEYMPTLATALGKELPSPKEIFENSEETQVGPFRFKLISPYI